jgi:hypothetical protein
MSCATQPGATDPRHCTAGHTEPHRRPRRWRPVGSGTGSVPAAQAVHSRHGRPGGELSAAGTTGRPHFATNLPATPAPAASTGSATS